MKANPIAVLLVGLLAVAAAVPARAHGPLFSPAPETVFKGGTEITLGFHTAKTAGGGDREKEYEVFLGAEYGLTADWEIGIEVPYAWKKSNGRDANGVGDIVLDTKYQFWKLDLPGAQYKAAAFVKAKLPTGDDGGRPRIGSGSTDGIGGLAIGYESRRWYWFASGVYRANTEGAGGLEKGDRQFLNVVGGVRPVLTEYDEPDTVLMVELNWEHAGRDDLNGAGLVNTGGWELFLSPVVWWTYGQLAIRGGVQIPIAEGLNGDQATSDYRARIEFIYHF
ncbi:MAG: transporter [Proteobacteria bacterium]|nr:transporter [Pseudomonadota bacterium]